jgi:hypothetical protein
VPTVAADALLGLLHPAWQALIAVCLLLVTILGVRRLAARGPARMTTAVIVTGGLIVALTVLGTFAVSCSQPDARRSTAEPR